MADNSGQLTKKGSVIIVQGMVPRELIMLQSGTLEILSAPTEFGGLDQDIVLSKSKRVGIISGKTILGGFSRNLIEPNCASLRAIDDCYISRYPLKGGIREIAMSDFAMAISILRNLYTRLTAVAADVVKYSKLFQSVSRVDDNIALIYRALGMESASSDIHSAADNQYKVYMARGGNFPQSFDGNFLVADNGRFLNKKYETPQSQVDTAYGRRFLDILKGILKLDPGILKAMFNADPEIAVSIYNSMSEDLKSAIDSIEAVFEYIDNEMKSLFGGAGSWASYLVDSSGLEDFTLTKKLSPDFIKHLLTVVSKISSNYDDLSGRKSSEIFPGIKKILTYTPKGGDRAPAAPDQGEYAATMQAPAIHTGDAGPLRKSMQQIFEFAVIDKEFQTKFIKMMNDFKKMSNPLASEDEPRKLRRLITKQYWDLFKSVFLRSKTESSIPRAAKFMLSYGYLDEELLEGSMINDLNELARRREPQVDNILFEEEFLTKIYNQQEEPSINEMGLNYAAYLRELEKSTTKKDKQVQPQLDENVRQTIYEIEQRLGMTAAVCSGSTSTAFPILNSYVARGSLLQIYTSKNKLQQTVKELMDIDYSAFFRETVLKIGDAREIIMEEVIPYFDILPIFGTKTLMWQEMSGNNKRSRGRIMVPVFFMGDFQKNIAHSFASFRWELNKTIKGGMWGDPIEGGVTGEYFDYVNTYKKNSKLTPDMKDKITERFKSFRTNRDRFADDYIQWVFNEREGILKLNTVVREIFFKHIPFKKEVRDKLEAMPAYQQMAGRYKNISARNYAGYERKFKKYQEANGTYPDVIQNFMNFLKY